MKREFLQNFKIGDQPLTKEIIDAIMEENGRDIEAAMDGLYIAERIVLNRKEVIYDFRT